jgi:hypothetical protein
MLHCRRIERELGTWIFAHYDQISELLIQYYRMPGYGAPDTDDILCISLASKLLPSRDEYSPLGVMGAHSMVLGDVTARHNETGLRCLPDPAPGDPITLDRAETSGRTLMKVICYCEPAAFELNIALPSRAELLSWRASPSASELVAQLSDPWFHMSVKVHCPVEARIVDQRLLREDPLQKLKLWVFFYRSVVHGAAYTAMHRPRVNDFMPTIDHLFAVEPRRRTDSWSGRPFGGSSCHGTSR